MPSDDAHLLALYRDHHQQREDSRRAHREVRQLALALARILEEHRALPDYPRWLSTVGIPPADADKLRALLQNSAPPPAATFARLEFSLPLTPQDAAITRFSLDHLLASGEAFDPGEIVSDALFFATQGPLHDALRPLRARPAHDFDPAAVAALPPIAIPSPAPARTPHPASFFLSPATDPEVTYLFSQYNALRRAQRRQSRLAARHLPELRRLFRLKHDELAALGRNGLFHAWLRRHHIPRSTAYRLLGPGFTPRNRPGITPDPPPALVLHAASATVRFAPKQATLTYRALTGFIDSGRVPNLSEIFASAFANLLPRSFRHDLQRLWSTPPTISPPRASSPLSAYHPLVPSYVPLDPSNPQPLIH